MCRRHGAEEGRLSRCPAETPADAPHRTSLSSQMLLVQHADVPYMRLVRGYLRIRHPPTVQWAFDQTVVVTEVRRVQRCAEHSPQAHLVVIMIYLLVDQSQLQRLRALRAPPPISFQCPPSSFACVMGVRQFGLSAKSRRASSIILPPPHFADWTNLNRWQHTLSAQDVLPFGSLAFCTTVTCTACE